MSDQSENNTVSKRVRRHVRAKEHSFFAVCQPGFENDCSRELERLTDLPSYPAEGGVVFRGKMDNLYRASIHSFCTTRFLMRIDRFRADNFDYFRKKFSDIPWDLFIHKNSQPVLSVTCRKSRLMHTGRLEEEAHSVLRKFAGNISQRIYIRFNHDICTVSLDASGEPLYKRSYRQHVTKAPLRETTASLILEHARIRNYSALIDPMAGSGVFSIEAFLLSNGTAPQTYHDFPFLSWPVFSEKTFNYQKTYGNNSLFNLKISTSDLAPENMEVIQHNFTRAGIGFTPQCCDFFEAANPFPSEKSLVVLNPPYDKRIPQISPADFYLRIFTRLNDEYGNSGFSVIIPLDIFRKIAHQIEYSDNVRFQNGDIQTMIVFRHV